MPASNGGLPAPSRDPLSTTLREALAGGTVVLAPNERAAGDLRARFNEAQLAAGLHAWEPAQIRPWNAWLESLWSALVTGGTEPRLLLNPAQEHGLWREIVAAAPDVHSLGSLDSLADLAQNAWHLAASYEALADLRRFAVTHDSRTFAAWAAAFNKRCEQRQYLSAAELPAALRAHIERGMIAPPRGLHLVGFDDDTPARAAVLAALAAQGCTIERLDMLCAPAQHALRVIVRAANPQEEVLTAARWIRNFIEAANPTLNPQQNTPHPKTRIALIVPKLQDERRALESTLRDVLAPELQAIGADLSSGPFAFAAGTPLAETAMVATALDLVRWIANPLPIERVGALLLSPYIGSASEIPERAAFDAFTLRQTPMLRPEIDIAHLLRLAAKSPPVARLLAPLAAHALQLRSSRNTRSYADWTEFIRDTLRDANWPGDRPLNAQEFRDARTWDHVLDSVATLDFTGARVDFATALEALERQAREASAAHGSNDASVQVMGPNDAAGSSFDAVVFLRATDANWLAPERANPLLGWPLQHEREMPGTDPARAAARAERATERLTACAPSVLFFFSTEDDSGAQRLSPTVERLGWSQVAASELSTAPVAPERIALEEIEDAAPLPPLASTSVRGGSLVLKLQAACGFRAFAEIRLGASPLEPASPGFDARQTGVFLHETLDRFWRQVETQDALRAMSQAERAAALEAAIDASLPRNLRPDGPWDDAYVSVQKDRLRSVLLQWLDRELQRGPFRVTVREQKKEVSVGPLTLRVRMDRIDEVEGGTLLVDYKTGGKSSPKDWEGERPDDPQLPLYALLPEAKDLQGIAFAKVRPGKEMKWLGYSGPGHLPKPAAMEHATLAEQIEAWRYVLEQLAQDFSAGKADVSPKEYPFTCTHCAQRLLCRLDVAALTADEEGNEAADVD
ncbi:MAG: PD-(D/E)XK nuclease family protein [Acidobacteriaceae bacterium]